MILNILHYPDERLRIVAKPVVNFDNHLKSLCNDMIETMYKCEGIGLAATQVGVNLRIMVIDVSEQHNNPYIFINPSIIKVSQEINSYKEGCLSVPDIFEVVQRPSIVNINYVDINNSPLSLQADGLLATCIQHEIDHLNGKVFIDRISRLKKSRIDSKIKKHSK